MHVKEGKRGFGLDKEDFGVHYYSGSGNGGSNRNKHQNCVRIVHKATGLVGNSQDHRDLPSNKKAAFERLTSNPRFKAWCEQKLREIEEGRSVEGWVQEQMKEENIVTEILDGRGK